MLYPVKECVILFFSQDKYTEDKLEQLRKELMLHPPRREENESEEDEPLPHGWEERRVNNQLSLTW